MRKLLYILIPTLVLGIAPGLAWAFGDPTASTQATSVITATSATFNGTVVTTGGLTVTTVGFAWGTNSNLSGGDTATTSQSVSITTAPTTFTYNAILACNTTYYDRAYDINGSPGTGLGTIVSFTTSSCPVSTPQVQVRSGVVSVKSGVIRIK